MAVPPFPPVADSPVALVLAQTAAIISKLDNINDKLSDLAQIIILLEASNMFLDGINNYTGAMSGAPILGASIPLPVDQI